MAFRTVFVKNGDKLSLKLDNLVVAKQGQELYIPLSDIENIFLEGDYTTITTRVLARLAENHIDVVVCDQTFHPCGIYLGMGQYHHAAKRNIWQASWNEDLKKHAWTEIVFQKVTNQIIFAQSFEPDDHRIVNMLEMRDNIAFGDATNREGHVAKMYFNIIYGGGFSRDDDNFPNMCMNYGYSVIRAQVARTVVSLGLIPSLGIFHKNEYNAFNLVDDLMEPFRPLMDWYIHRQIEETNDKYLTYENRLKIIEFLNKQIKINGKIKYINAAVNEYVNSFIAAMETKDFSKLIDIDIENFWDVKENGV